MMEDRIIVQDRGLDACTAALLAKNNNDPMTAAMMANGGFGMNGMWNNPLKL